MDRSRVRAWLMYDWANSAFATTVVAAVLPVFYTEVAAAELPGHLATTYWGYAQAAALFLIAVMAPVLGAIADLSGNKMFFLRLFSWTGIIATLAFAFVGPGDYLFCLLVLVVATVGFSGANAFYDALLPDLVPEARRDYVSSLGYAVGYIGGGLLLVANLIMIQKPGWFGLPDALAATRAVFVTVSFWWLLFALPLFVRVRDERRRPALSLAGYARTGFRRIAETARGVSRYPELAKYLAAYWLFSDGINTVIRMAVVYGAEVGIGSSDLIVALVVTQFVGIPCTVLFGKIAEKYGPKRSLYVSLSIYTLIVSLGYFMTTAAHFYALAFMVGVVQGGSQAVARSLFSRLVPDEREAEFFGFFAVSGKLSAVFGPLLFSTAALLTGSGRSGIFSLVAFFVLGIALLARVDLAKGAREAGRAAAET